MTFVALKSKNVLDILNGCALCFLCGRKWTVKFFRWTSCVKGLITNITISYKVVHYYFYSQLAVGNLQERF